MSDWSDSDSEKASSTSKSKQSKPKAQSSSKSKSESVDEKDKQEGDDSSDDELLGSVSEPVNEEDFEALPLSSPLGNNYLQSDSEEMARLREGFRLAMERWQNMSEDEKQAEMASWQGMRGRWEAMSDEERQAAMERGRQRF